MKSRASTLFLLGSVTLGSAALAEGYYRTPTLHGDILVFAAEGDLWRNSVDGGPASRLTSHPAEESTPVLSPDGQTVAFSAEYEGATEVYTMPLAGGRPARCSFEGGRATPVSWTADGRLLYATAQYSTLPDTQLVELDPVAGTRRLIPLSQAADGVVSPLDGTLFFTRLPFQGSHTKRYRGGTAQRIWAWREGQPEARPLTADHSGTSKSPMWWEGRIYFVSDRDGTMNLWSMQPDGTELRQHTAHQGWEVASPSLSQGRIVYQLGADLRLFVIASGDDRRLDLLLTSDFDQTRETWVQSPMDYLTAAALSPNGDRVVLTARGQVFVAPVGKGRLVEATRGAGVRYRRARFLPDGKSLLALSDESGEVELWTLPANGVGDRQQLTTDGEVLRWDGRPSPDGRFVAHHDKNQQLWLLDVERRTQRLLTTNSVARIREVAWSPDSRWLAYTAAASNRMWRIFLYRVDSGETLAATSDRYDSYSPAWSRDGDLLYFLSDRHLRSLVASPWGPRQPDPFLPSPTEIYALALRPGVRSPFDEPDELHPAAAGDDQASEDGGTTDGEAKKGEKGPVTPPAVEIHADGLAERLFRVPAPPGDYDILSTDGKRLYWLAADGSFERQESLQSLSIGSKRDDPKVFFADLEDYELSPDGEKLLVRTEKVLYVFPAADEAPEKRADAEVDLSAWTFSFDPREQWRQMFLEGWRLERDYFYDRGMHGVDWPAVRDKYLPLVERVTTRAELRDLLAQMVSELSALHIFVYGGDDREAPDEVEVASLGAELWRDEAVGGYVVRRLYRADPDRPEELSPLARLGVGVVEGDVLLAIDGVPLLSVPDPALLLRRKADRQVLLRWRAASGGEPRDVVVRPISQRAEADLRYDDWELSRRSRVEAAGGGAVGYLHLRAMGRDNYTEWAREYFPVFDRQGLIIDLRHNRGGNIDSWILGKLLRRAWFYWQARVGEPYWNMQYAFRGHLVVLVDERTASDGEAFAEGFRRLGLGKVIGTRTWGGEIWLSSSNRLVDGGIATAAEFGVYGPEGEWLIEGHGVDPDIVVDNLPRATFDGEDAQLDAAIRYLQERIREEPVAVPPPPAYPDKSAPASP